MRSLFRKKEKQFDGDGLVLFKTTAEALRAEKVLKKSGIAVKLIAPPVSRRKGCDLAIEVNLMEKVAVERLLREEGMSHEGFEVLSSETSKPIEIVKTTDFGDFTMVKVGNMKMTYNRKTAVITNISGGGCPDIPYLSIELVGRKVTEAVSPRELGSTLCALMLDRAYEECCRLLEDNDDTADSRYSTN